MSHDDIQYLAQQHIAVKLLKANNAPLIISFLFLTFKQQNQQTIPEGILIDRLDDYLFALKEQQVGNYPKSAKAYLTDWVEAGFLRRFYGQSGDEPMVQLTSNVEVVFTWVQSLNTREFVGTESRLLQIFSLLEDLTEKSTTNAEERIALLEKQQEEIQQEIDRIKNGEEPTALDDTQVKERFYELEDMSYKLLADFRKIEENFRELDRATRERQLKASYTKGEIIGEVVDAQESLSDTDQGRSFNAFWEFLMSQSKQDQLDDLIAQVLTLPQVQTLTKSSQLQRFKMQLIEAGDQVNGVNHLLVEHLRQFLNNYTQAERKQMIDAIEAIEKEALEVKEAIPAHQHFFSWEDKAEMNFDFVRPLFKPTQQVVLSEEVIEEGTAEAATDMLFEQTYIDPFELKRNIKQLLKKQPQVSLKEITTVYPISKGLQEVLTYYTIATQERKATIQEEVIEKIAIRNERGTNPEAVSLIELPQVIFTS